MNGYKTWYFVISHSVFETVNGINLNPSVYDPNRAYCNLSNVDGVTVLKDVAKQLSVSINWKFNV